MSTPAEGSSEYRVVGTRPIRHDGVDKVTGRAKYGADFQAAGLLYGKVLRSPHAHARIKSIDVSRALRHPGVKAVVTSQDLPVPPDEPVSLGEGPLVNLRYVTENTLAREKVLYKGHPVAAVAAETVHVAEEALALIDVEYEVLPPVMSVLEAMKEDAPILHETMTTTSMDEDTGRVSNVATHTRFNTGDVEKGFQEAYLVVEREYTTSTVHQGYIEPQNATVIWNADGEVTIWLSNQGHFGVRQNTAPLIGVPVSKVHVVPMEIGGGFGGKIPIYLEPPAALLSLKTGRPVKMVMTRAEVLEATGPGAGSYMKVKMGVTREGQIVAAQAYLAFDAGAFPGSPVNAGAMCMFSSYSIENIQIDAYDVVVNKPKTSAYRAPGSPQATFAVESLVDEICERLGIDPLEFRLKNASKEGDRRVDGVAFGRIGNMEVLKAARESLHYNTRLEGKHRGRGVASGFWFNGGGQSSCTIAVNGDGTVQMVTGSVDIGGTRASTAMQAAEVLGLRAKEVHPLVGDTSSIGYTGVTGGSRTTFATGWAAYEAAQDVVRQMKERAARLWETRVEEVEFANGIFNRKTKPAQSITFREMCGRLMETGGPLIGKSTVSPRGVGPAFAHHIVDVEVDVETGKVEVLRYTAVQDVGKAVHPSYVEGQIQGGVAQGVGWALNEEYFYNDRGVLVNSSLLDYRMPTCLDMPMIDTILVEVPNPGHPFGVRGVGEVPIVPPLAAVANAVYHAIGVRMRDLPMKPGRVLQALWEKDGRGSKSP
ncbi:MAG: xanthine dehydrogenase family protein molybdopterin-binding subunit [Chloroflexi bacterium]|nr:xanthine dehydrogenase family protein molybdopterin-binding subunit [Chloroflexota bacterium]